MPDSTPSVPTVQDPLSGCLASAVKLSLAGIVGLFVSALSFGIGATLSWSLGMLLGTAAFFGSLVGVLVIINKLSPQPGFNLVSSDTRGHWSQMIEGLELSPSGFYGDLEAHIETKQIPNLTISRVAAHEGGALAGKRIYLAARRGDLIFLVCGAPFGNGFFVSWWLGYHTSFLTLLLSFVPLAALLFPWLLRGRTFYEQDTTQMFQTLVHGAVLDLVSETIETKGLRALTEAERTPTSTLALRD